MSIWERFKRWRLSHTINEADAPADTSTAMTRAEGGDPGDDTDSRQSGAEKRSQATQPRRN